MRKLIFGMSLHGRKLWETMSSHRPTDAVAEITRLRPRTAARWASAAAMRAGLIDEYALATYPVLVGGGTPLFTALANWVNLNPGRDACLARPMRPGDDVLAAIPPTRNEPLDRSSMFPVDARPQKGSHSDSERFSSWSGCVGG